MDGITIDVDAMAGFLVDLLNVPSPTGDAGRVIALVQERIAALLHGRTRIPDTGGVLQRRQEGT